MSEKDKQEHNLTGFGAGVLDHQKALFGVLSQNMGQMTEAQRALFALTAACTAHVMESVIATQREAARLSMDAVVHGDAVALMSVAHRAAQFGFREGMECAARNLQAAKTAGAQAFETMTTPPGMQPGSTILSSQEKQT